MALLGTVLSTNRSAEVGLTCTSVEQGEELDHHDCGKGETGRYGQDEAGFIFWKKL